MNKLTPIILALTITASGCDGPISNPADVTNPLIQAEYEYEVDTWGRNVDILEFPTRSNPGITCMLVISGNDMLRNTFCFPNGRTAVTP